jgi:hypothetical protein
MVISNGWIRNCISVLMGIGHIDPLRMERAGQIWNISAIAGFSHRAAGIPSNTLGYLVIIAKPAEASISLTE